MFDLDTGKLLIIGVVALVVIGPKDLPGVLRQAGQAVGKLRRMAGEFQGQFMDAVREADLQDLRNEVVKIKDTASIDVHFDPARDIRSEIVGAVEGSRDSAPAISSASALVAAPAPLPELTGPPAAPVDAFAAGIAPVSEPSPVEPEAEAPDTAKRNPRRKITPSRHRDGSRIAAQGPRERASAYLPPRPDRALRREPPEA